jgi:hypothetical protein
MCRPHRRAVSPPTLQHGERWCSQSLPPTCGIKAWCFTSQNQSGLGQRACNTWQAAGCAGAHVVCNSSVSLSCHCWKPPGLPAGRAILFLVQFTASCVPSWARLRVSSLPIPVAHWPDATDAGRVAARMMRYDLWMWYVMWFFVGAKLGVHDISPLTM